MIVQVLFSGQTAELHLDGDPDSLLVADLCFACSQRFPSVPVDHQKLLCKGNILHRDHSLIACDLRDGSKVMLLASSPHTQAQQRASERSGYRRKQAESRREARLSALDAADAIAAKPAPQTQEELQAQRRAAWKASHVVSLRDKGISELPDLRADWELLGLDTVARLRAIDVGNNNLTSIPDMFAPLQGLKRFCCDHNSLVTEGIPWETLARLPKLSHQIMDNNRLTSLPSVFGQASALRVLKLSANALTALPESLGSLGSLEELHVSHNQLEELPEQLGGCARLHWLAASNNKIEGIPDSFRMLKCLRGLILDDNRVASVPSIVLKECLELHTLSIRANPITMEQLRAVDGFEELAQRRKGMLDKVVDAKLGANFTEAADYSQGS